MKKSIIFLSVVAFVIACNNDSKEEKKDTATTEEKKDAATDITQHPDYQKGLDLIAKSDCLTCHNLTMDERIVGPTYREVANKYASAPDTIVGHLASKIIQGGSGVWGEVMMTPHPSLSEEDAKAMVKYILLLKK